MSEVRDANEQLLRTLPFKFASGLRYYSLAPGERLLSTAFQPAIWRRGTLPIRRQVSPNMLLAKTDRKLILIEETRAQLWRRPAAQGEYGWIFTYIPVDRVVEMNVTPAEALSALHIKLQWGAAEDTRSIRLEPAVAAQWQEAWLSALERI